MNSSSIWLSSWIIVALAWLWLTIAYGIWFWRTRRAKAQKEFITAFFQTWMWNIIFGVRYYGMIHSAIPNRFRIKDLILPTMILLFLVIKIIPLWTNKDPLPDFAHSRDMLLLKRPISPHEQPSDPSQGLFVPSNVKPADLETVDIRSWRSWKLGFYYVGILIMWGILLSMVFFK